MENKTSADHLVGGCYLLTNPEKFQSYFEGQQHDHDQNNGADDFRTVLQRQTGAQILAGGGEYSGDQTQGDQYLSCGEGGKQSANIG